MADIDCTVKECINRGTDKCGKCNNHNSEAFVSFCEYPKPPKPAPEEYEREKGFRPVEGLMIYRMYGDTVQLLRYKVAWEETQGEETAAREHWCASAEERDEIIARLGDRPHTVEAVDQTGNEWIDGMEFKDASKVPAALEMGEAAWWDCVNANDRELQTAIYLTDLDYRLLILEWGITA